MYSCSTSFENLDSPDVVYKTIALLLLSVMANAALVAFSEAELGISVVGLVVMSLVAGERGDCGTGCVGGGGEW